MTLIDQMLTVARAYADAEGVDLPRASWRAFRETKTLADLAAGKTSPTLKRADAAMRWFSDHWPDSATWPDAVPRPAPSSDTAPTDSASRGKPALASTGVAP